MPAPLSLRIKERCPARRFEGLSQQVAADAVWISVRSAQRIALGSALQRAHRTPLQPLQIRVTGGTASGSVGPLRSHGSRCCRAIEDSNSAIEPLTDSKCATVATLENWATAGQVPPPIQLGHWNGYRDEDGEVWLAG